MSLVNFPVTTSSGTTGTDRSDTGTEVHQKAKAITSNQQQSKAINSKRRIRDIKATSPVISCCRLGQYINSKQLSNKQSAASQQRAIF